MRESLHCSLHRSRGCLLQQSLSSRSPRSSCHWMPARAKRRQPSNNTVLPHELWSFLFLTEQQAAPEIARCVSALIVMAWQNVVVERDISVVTEVQRRADGQLATGRLSSRCRAAIDGPPPQKDRAGRVDGVLATIAKERCMRRRRQDAPSWGPPRGAQGRTPQRAACRAPRPFVRGLPPPPLQGRLDPDAANPL